MFSKSAVLISALVSSTLALPSVIPRQNAGWTVTGLTRTCDAAQCNYSFKVNNGSSNRACSLTDKASNPGTHSFYAVSCKENPNLVISWGYNPSGGFAVMTVVDASTHKDAFFGWNNVNSNTKFPDVGPNPSYDM